MNLSNFEHVININYCEMSNILLTKHMTEMRKGFVGNLLSAVFGVNAECYSDIGKLLKN